MKQEISEERMVISMESVQGLHRIYEELMLSNTEPV